MDIVKGAEGRCGCVRRWMTARCAVCRGARQEQAENEAELPEELSQKGRSAHSRLTVGTDFICRACSDNTDGSVASPTGLFHSRTSCSLNPFRTGYEN